MLCSPAFPPTRGLREQVSANDTIFDRSRGFATGPAYQVKQTQQLARFLDCQVFYKPAELSVLVRAIGQETQCAPRGGTPRTRLARVQGCSYFW